MTSRKLASLPLFATLALAALSPGVASAGSVELAGSTLTYTAKAGEQNVLGVSPADGSFVVRDLGAAAIADRDGPGGCIVGPQGATCPAAGVTEVEVRLLDGDDRVRITTPTADRIKGGDGADVLRSEIGNDRLYGEAGADQLYGGADNDQLDGGADPDLLSGGPGASDAANYKLRTEAISVRINNVADDGSATDARADDVRTDVERVLGGAGDDALTGNSSANVLSGGEGEDVLRGLDGSDELLGDAGSDDLDGGTGPDEVSGGSGSRDRAIYASRTAGVAVDLDDLADDGESAEQDNVHSDVEDLAGGRGNDLLIADADRNRLTGGAGADDLRSSDGDDTLLGQADGDRLDAGIGADVVDDGEGLNTVDAGDGDDTLLQGANPNPGETLNGGPGTDTVSYERRASAVKVTVYDTTPNDGDKASSEADHVTAVENLVGGQGDDELEGDGGPNQIRAGAGNDRVLAYGSDDVLEGELGDDSLTGHGENDTLDGGDGNDALEGGAGNDTARGASGDDSLNEFGTSGGELGGFPDGDDDLSGGPGTDTVSYEPRLDPVWVSLNDVADDGDLGPTELDNARSDIERVVLTDGADRANGSAAGNEIIGRGGKDTLHGGDGNDVLRGGDEPDDGDTIYGGTGDDQVLGGAGRDILDGDDGNDSVDGGDDGDILGEDSPGVNGVDHVAGGSGYDSVRYDDRTMPLAVSLDDVANDGAAGEGDNVRSDVESIFGGRAGDTLIGNDGANNFIGGFGDAADTIDGRGGADQMEGRGGADTLYGGEGDDYINGDYSFDIAGEVEGGDYIDGEGGDDRLLGEGGTDTIRGYYGNDRADGGPDNDNINGQEGDDIVHGGDASDDVTGGGGTDEVYGDNDGDYLRAWDRVKDTVNGGAGHDAGEIDRSCFLACWDLDDVAEVEVKVYQ